MNDDHEARITALEKHCAGISGGMNRLTLLIICTLIVQIIGMILDYLPRSAEKPAPITSASTGNSTSVITAPLTSPLTGRSRRTYLTTADVAQREAISAREVIDMIMHGEIEPAPFKDGREWRIDADYRIVPQNPDDCTKPRK